MILVNTGAIPYVTPIVNCTVQLLIINYRNRFRKTTLLRSIKLDSKENILQLTLFTLLAFRSSLL